MPLYEYECDACSKVHEVSQKMSDAPLANCPDCGSAVKKLISLSSFAFKGSGFYTTDYKRAGSKSEEKAAAPAPACGANTGGCGKPECAKT